MNQIRDLYINNSEITLLNCLMGHTNHNGNNVSYYHTMHSNITKIADPQDEKVDNIILITQFYISTHESRQKEILKCLKLNLNNNLIDKIYLLNERIYTEDEMKISSNSNKSKINQINIKSRLKYSDVFEIIDRENIKGYILLSNSDIFFDITLLNLYKSGLHNTKKIYNQLRFEYTNKDLNKCLIFGPRGDSQDCWIFHSNYNIKDKNLKIFNFNLGIPGCDNHVSYIFAILGFQLHNEPYFIKSYHHHTTAIRSYNNSTIPAIKPWLKIMPIVHEHIKNWISPNQNIWRFSYSGENNKLKEYIKYKINNRKNFILPIIDGIENNFAGLGTCIKNNSINNYQVDFINKNIGSMKYNTGINLSSRESIVKYSDLYLSAFNNCDTYFEHAKWSIEYKNICSSNDFINSKFKTKTRFWIQTLEIYNNIYNDPWTIALKSKNLLIISPFIEHIKEKILISTEIYGVDLFPECKFVFLESPKTYGNYPSNDFELEIKNFMIRVNDIKNDFDIALCSCGGFGNLICNEIFKLGKSAICVGSVLPLYFGIYNNRYMKERPDIFRLFMNKNWIKQTFN